MERKADAKGIELFLNSLAEDLGLTDYRRTWPRYLFHIAELDNAVSILKSGVLYDRESAIQLDLLAKDTANPEVVANTSASARQCARLTSVPERQPSTRPKAFDPSRRLNILNTESR